RHTRSNRDWSSDVCASDLIPGITTHQEQYAREVCDQLSGVADWEFPRAARNRGDIEEILGGFNQRGLDGVMIVMLTYSPAMRTRSEERRVGEEGRAQQTRS